MIHESLNMILNEVMMPATEHPTDKKVLFEVREHLIWLARLNLKMARNIRKDWGYTRFFYYRRRFNDCLKAARVIRHHIISINTQIRRLP